MIFTCLYLKVKDDSAYREPHLKPSSRDPATSHPHSLFNGDLQSIMTPLIAKGDPKCNKKII